MTMTIIQQNIASEMQDLARQLIVIRGRLAAIELMWTNENMAALTDADFAELAPFAHVTVAEFVDAAMGLAAVNITLGTSSTSNWAKFLKIVDGVPK